jgi:prepilin-type processing-associated H-X9-DG protein
MREYSINKSQSHVSLFFQAIGSLVIVLSMHGMSSASIETLNFTSGVDAGSVLYVEDGFRVRPQSDDHYELNGANFLWHDGSANTAPNILTVDFANGSNSPFSPLSVNVVAIPSSYSGILFKDSFGNTLTATTVGIFDLSALADNTTFITFQTVNNYIGANDYYVYIDDLKLDNTPQSVVPEPTTLFVWSGLGLVVAGSVYAKKRKAAQQNA